MTVPFALGPRCDCCSCSVVARGVVLVWLCLTYVRVCVCVHVWEVHRMYTERCLASDQGVMVCP